MSSGTIWPGSLAANARSPGPPTAVYSVMNSVPPANARPSAPMKPPCCPPTEVPVCIWIAMDIHDNSPDSAKTLSLGSKLSSSTGITVPTIFDSMPGSLVPVVGIDHAAARGVRRRVARTIVADPDHQHLGPYWPESVALLEVGFELAHELFLYMQHPSAHLAHRVVVVAARKLVMSRPLTQVRRVHRAGSGQGLQRPIDGAARKTGSCLAQLLGDLVRRAVPAEAHDHVVDHRPLRGAPHAGRQHQPSPAARKALTPGARRALISPGARRALISPDARR